MKRASKVVEAKVEPTTAQKIANKEASLVWSQEWALRDYERIILHIGEIAAEMRKQANEVERVANMQPFLAGEDSNSKIMDMVGRVAEVMRNDRQMTGMMDLLGRAKDYEETRRYTEQKDAEQRAEIVALKAQLQKEQEVQG